MKKSRKEIMADVQALLQEMAEDWEYSGPITKETCFLADMGLQSLDVVVLGTAVQERYGRPLPFQQLFIEIGQRQVRDISVGEWVDFIYEHYDGSERESGEGGRP
jgi:acyl carrier protein